MSTPVKHKLIWIKILATRIDSLFIHVFIDMFYIEIYLKKRILIHTRNIHKKSALQVHTPMWKQIFFPGGKKIFFRVWCRLRFRGQIKQGAEPKKAKLKITLGSVGYRTIKYSPQKFWSSEKKVIKTVIIVRLRQKKYRNIR